jgi:4-amino-4-deoxy-L-arabinose transferase-like glycosyltransferase
VYVWKLDQNGWANSYYAAAVQAGQNDLNAFIFGAADWGNSITVDKPPLSLWVMGLSVRIFGLNPWAMLLPQALITLASTFFVYKVARHSFSGAVALVAAAVFAATPITVLLARYNNPDPLMVLFMLGGLYAGVRGTAGGKPRLLYVAAALLSLGFLAKQLQAFLVLPAICMAFVIYSGLAWRKRISTMATAGMLLMAESLFWPLFVDSTSREVRPYVGGSRTDSMLELTLGYNGLDRVIQQEEAPSAALIPAELRSVATDAGLFRLFNANYGQEIGWLLLPAILASIAIIVRLLRGGYDRNKSIIAVVSVAWFVTTFIVLSFMGDNFHSYYSASLAAPLALCVGLGVDILFQPGRSSLSRILTATTLVASFIFFRAMWQLSSVYPEWLGAALFFLGLFTAAMLCVPAPKEWMVQLAKASAIAALFVGPIVCSAITVASPQEGSNPLSGSLSNNPNTLSRFLHDVKLQNPAWAAGVAIGSKPTPALADVLRAAPADCTWAAATYPGQTAARFQLEVGRPVMALGGFAGVDPSPTSPQFQEWVASGQVCFLVEQPEQLAVPGNSEELKSIQEWVSKNFRAEKIDGVTVYRLTS